MLLLLPHRFVTEVDVTLRASSQGGTVRPSMNSLENGMYLYVVLPPQLPRFSRLSATFIVQVHTFLLRHVYTSTITAYHFSKFQAAFVTFFLSACVVCRIPLVPSSERVLINGAN